MFTDIVGYTAMAQADESVALDLLKRHRELVRAALARHGGREVKTMGDAFLLEFSSALAATECAIELEDSLRRFNEKRREKVRVRVGIHVGDVVHEEGDVYGDAVNIASRIPSLAEGGGVCLSQHAYEQVRNKVPYGFTRLGVRDLKNVSFPIEVYRLELAEPRAEAPKPTHSNSMAVIAIASISDKEYI